MIKIKLAEDCKLSKGGSLSIDPARGITIGKDEVKSVALTPLVLLALRQGKIVREEEEADAEIEISEEELKAMPREELNDLAKRVGARYAKTLSDDEVRGFIWDKLEGDEK